MTIDERLVLLLHSCKELRARVQYERASGHELNRTVRQTVVASGADFERIRALARTTEAILRRISDLERNTGSTSDN